VPDAGPETVALGSAVGRRTTCRGCGGSSLGVVLELGSTALANRLLTPEQLGEAEPIFPLTLGFCPQCSLVQLLETVAPALLFREYLYFSSFSDTMLQHAEALARELIDRYRLGPRRLVVELASNDGYLLQYFLRAGIKVLGIDPAVNIAKVAEARGIPTLAEFFDAPLAAKLRARGQVADVIIGINVLGHVANLNGFVAGIARLLRPGGAVVIEAPYVKDMIDRNEFDTIYHEHLHYFSVTSLYHLFRRHGLVITDAERLPIHGGSLRVTAMHAAHRPDGARVEALLAEEGAWGVNDVEFYRAFAQRVSALRSSLRALLAQLKGEGRRIAAYGAAAKGHTLLSYCGIGAESLDFVVDRSTYKQGRHMAGSHLPIYAPAKLLEARPDFVLLLTWNFAEEILAQQAAYVGGGGRFIVPVPEPRVMAA
jgi:SAM-dependent methyltransferase